MLQIFKMLQNVFIAQIKNTSLQIIPSYLIVGKQFAQFETTI